MAKQKEAWDKLSMQEKAQLIKLSVDNGVSSLKQIRDTYNLYSSGGKKKSTVNRPRDIDEAIYISRNTPYNKNIDDVEGPGYREYMWKLAQAKSKVWGISPQEAYESFVHPSEFNYRRWYNLASQDELDNALTNGDAHWMDVFGKTVGADTFSNESPYSGYSNPYNPKGITGGTWTGRLGIDEYIPSESQIDNDWPLNKAWFAIDRGNKYYQEKISKGEDTHEVPSIMTYNNGVMLPEITVTPRGNYIEYYPYANGGNLAHKKSGEEQKESQGLNSSWLPDFAYNPVATQSQIQNVLGITPMTAQEQYTAQEVVKEIDNPGYTQMKQNAQKAQMLKAGHIVEENPGLLNMAESGVIDYLPVLGDAKQATEVASAALQGDFTEAALLGMFTILPGATDKIASKALKNITKQDRDFIKAANQYFKKYGYEPLDLNLADQGRSVVNQAIKDRINHLNTVSRGVYTIKDSFLNSIQNLSVDDIVQISKNQGINFNDVKNAFELNKKLTDLGLSPTAENRLKYSLTHIPGHTGHGRAGLNTGEQALYTSNSWGDINSVADRYSMPQWANPEIYEGAVGVLRRKFQLSPDNNRNKWFFEGDFPLLNRNNDVYPVLRYLKSHAEPNRKIEIDKDILNKVYEYVKDIQKQGRAKNKSILNELNNTQSILKTRGFPYNIHIKNKFQLEAIQDYLKNLDSPILNKKDISNIYNIIGKYKWGETPLFDKINTRQAIQQGYKKVYHDQKFVQSLLDQYFPNIWQQYVEFPIKTTEALKRAPKGVNRTQHFIFTGIPGEEPVELLEYIPTNYNKNLSHGHNSNTTPGTRKTFSTGGPLYPFSFEKNPFLKTPVVRYDEGGFFARLFGKKDTPPTPEEIKADRVERFINDTWETEYSVPKGYDHVTGLYFPYDSPEGGTKTIGPGFKLREDGSGDATMFTAKEAARGVTREQINKKLRAQGELQYDKVLEFLNQKGNRLPVDTINSNIMNGLMDLRFQVGTLGGWNNLREAVLNGDLEGIKKESKVTFKDEKTGKIKVDTRRNDLRAEKFWHYD